jgi:hypothetical protein
MINSEQVKEAFFGMVSIGQTMSNLPKIDADLAQNTSGLVLNDLHPFFTHENIYDSANGLDQYATKESDIRAYDAIVAYKKDDIVRHSAITYRCIVNSTGNLPTNTAYFLPTNLYSHYLRRKLNYAYSESVRAVLDAKMGYSAQGKTIVSNVLLYDGRGLNDTVEKRGRFVGYKVFVLRPNMKFNLHRVAIQLTEAQDLDIYIFQANNPDPLAVQTVSYTTPYKMTEFTINPITFGSELSTNEYLIGYYESDLVGRAIKRDIDLVSPSLGCCNNVSYSYFQKFSSFVDIKPFYVESDYLTNNELSWSSGEEVVINGNNFGMNMNFTVNCDLTDLIIQQKALFKPLIQQTLVVSILKDIINSTRDNATANNVRGLVLANGTIQGYIKTEEDRLKKRIDSVSLDMSTLDSTCMPKSTRFRIKTGSF